MKIPIWRRRLKVAHASLKDKATPKQVARHMQRIVDRQEPHLIGATEAQRGDSRAVNTLLASSGYESARAGGRMVTWKTRRLRLLGEPEWKRLTFIYSGNEAWRDLWVLVAKFVDLANGLRYCVFVFHFAAGVERGDRWKEQNVNGVRVHEVGWPVLRRLMEAADDDGFMPIAIGDTNLDAKRDSWKAYMARQMGDRINSVWKGRKPKKGSHGGRRGRLIDNMFAMLGWTRGWVMALARLRPMDHDVVIGILNLTPALRERGLLNRKK